MSRYAIASRPGISSRDPATSARIVGLEITTETPASAAIARSRGRVRLSRLASGGGAGMAITPGVEAAEERLEEIQPGRKEQQRPIPRRPGRLQPRRDPPRLPIQLGVGEPFASPGRRRSGTRRPGYRADRSARRRKRSTSVAHESATHAPCRPCLRSARASCPGWSCRSRPRSDLIVIVESA